MGEPVELQFLRACAELGQRQRELRALVAQAIGRDPYDYWIGGDGREDPALDGVHRTVCGEWSFHFHGLEFDVRHVEDGRSVRVDFGPGAICAFTPGGVGAFVQCVRAPWQTFPELRDHLAGRVDYDYARCVGLVDTLRALGLIDHASPQLVALVAAHSRLEPGRGMVLQIPAELYPADENGLLLCSNLVITEKGFETLRSLRSHER